MRRETQGQMHREEKRNGSRDIEVEVSMHMISATDVHIHAV